MLLCDVAHYTAPKSATCRKCVLFGCDGGGGGGGSCKATDDPMSLNFASEMFAFVDRSLCGPRRFSETSAAIKCEQNRIAQSRSRFLGLFTSGGSYCFETAQSQSLVKTLGGKELGFEDEPTVRNYTHVFRSQGFTLLKNIQQEGANGPRTWACTSYVYCMRCNLQKVFFFECN